jgi:hypothetical protein
MIDRHRRPHDQGPAAHAGSARTNNAPNSAAAPSPTNQPHLLSNLISIPSPVLESQLKRSEQPRVAIYRSRANLGPPGGHQRGAPAVVDVEYRADERQRVGGMADSLSYELSSSV